MEHHPILPRNNIPSATTIVSVIGTVFSFLLEVFTGFTVFFLVLDLIDLFEEFVKPSEQQNEQINLHELK